MSPNPPPVMVRCADECEAGRIECPECSGHGEVLVRVRPTFANATCPEDGFRDEGCERCEGKGELECGTCKGAGEYEWEEWMGVRQLLPEVL